MKQPFFDAVAKQLEERPKASRTQVMAYRQSQFERSHGAWLAQQIHFFKSMVFGATTCAAPAPG